MKKKVVFLDRDGTINVDKEYLYKIEEFEFIPGVIEALRRFQEEGYLLIIITNQSGIGRGYYSIEDFNILNAWMESELKKENIDINKVYFCPHIPDARIKEYRKECRCRKPRLGMFIQAIKEFDIDISNSIAIGDKIRDCAICDTTACKGFLVGENEDREIIEDVRNAKYTNVFYAKDLLEVVQLLFEK